MLLKYAGNDSSLAPQFKTWFYIYKNNSAEEAFKKILTEDYLVEVKEIERFDFDFDEPRTEDDEISEKTFEKLPPNSKDLMQFDDLKNDKISSVEGFETLKSTENGSSIDQAIADYDSLDKKVKNNISKFDRHVDESQYIENLKQNHTFDKNLYKKKLQKENEGPEKVSLPLKKYMENSMEIMEAQESRHFVTRVKIYL